MAQRFVEDRPVVERFGLTAEQAAVVMSRGKVVVAAGAGSGKTQTAVAWIASLVQEHGYRPDQVLTCSFTRAASSELEGRVEQRARVIGANIGTTHAIARMVITTAHPELQAQCKSTKMADKCFKLAMKQVELSAEVYAEQLKANREVLAGIEAIPGWRGQNFLASLHKQICQGRTLSDKQMAALNRQRGFCRRYAYDDDGNIAVVEAVPVKVESDFEGDRQSPYWKTPVGQWFNLGEKLVDDEGKPFGIKRATLAVENFKNSGISVEDAWQTYGQTEGFMRLVAALYGAYEWLKKNDPLYAPCMDYTDQLIKALDILQTEPRTLAFMQKRFPVVIVDEAQDLNQIQFDFFGLLGARASVLAYVGDDKQSIYAFRGARPQNYVGLTKLPGYATLGITMNFRSGKAIVDAANKLMVFNGDRQIPMTCEADPRKGLGNIVARAALTHEDGAEEVAQEIRNFVDAGQSPKEFGVLVRNNAEADAFTLALISRMVPYRMLKRSEGGYFGKPLVKALIAWMTMMVSTDDDAVNSAAVTAHMTPGFMLDRMFAAGLSRVPAGMNFRDYLLSGGAVYAGSQEWRNRNASLYASAIRGLQASGSLGNSEDLIRSILAIRGPKGTFEDALVEMVNEEDVIEDEGNIEPSSEALRDAALAPLRPLMRMAKNCPDPVQMLGFITKMKAANEKVQKKTPDEKDDWKEPAVLVGTVHGWKGLEAKHIYVCMAGGVFPNFRTDKLAATDETAYDEERRLAYVAITRGEQSVTIVAPAQTYLGKPATTSRFIGEAGIEWVGEPPKAVEVQPPEAAMEYSYNRAP